jgi:branched-chain amino acid transport system substrate-binding protein
MNVRTPSMPPAPPALASSWGNLVRTVVVFVALVAAVGCARTDSPTTTVSDVEEVCATDPFGCVVFNVGDPVELGALLWLGADSSQSGVGSRVAVELAVDYLDGVFDGVPGDLLGHPVEVIIEDDGCSREDGIVAAERLRAEPRLLAVVGTTCSSAALDGAAVVFGEAGILLVSPSATAPALTDPDNRQRFFFRTAPNDAIQGSVLADFVVRSLTPADGDPVVVATVDDGGPYSGELAQVFGQRIELQGGVVAASPTLGASEASPEAVAEAVAAVAAAAPDVVFLPLFEPNCSTLVTALRAVPALADTEFVVAEACVGPRFLEVAGPAGDGVFGSAPDFSDTSADPFYTQEFLPAFERRFGGLPPGVWHAHAFDAANLIFDATRRVAIRLPGGAFAVPRSALRSAFLDVSRYRGVSGLVTCTPSGDCAQSARIAVYEAPLWPVEGGSAGSPTFSQSKNLAEVRNNQ